MGNAMGRQRVKAVAGLSFHPAACGANLCLDAQGTRATRSRGFCGGLALSARPVRACERVHVRLGLRDPEWQGALRVGFTCRDPDRIPLPLPPYALPDLVDQRQSWADRVPEEVAVPGAEVAFWVQADGRMFCSARLPHDPWDAGRETRVWRLKGRVETRKPLWAIVDVYGATREVQLLGTTMDLPICSARRCTHGSVRTKASPPPSPPPLPVADGTIAAALDAGPAAAPGRSECIVCMHKPRQAAFIPCGHYCVCAKCAALLGECPLCRCPGGNILLIYCP